MKPVRIITVSSLYGGGGPEVAERIAKGLGWNLLDHELLKKIAQRANVDEKVAARYDQHVDPWFNRMVKAIWRGGSERGSAGSGEGLMDCEGMLEFTRNAMHEAADIGNCVIMGRGGQCILGDRKDAFHVFLYAPVEYRARRLQKSEGGDLAHAQALAERVDKERVAYIRRYFGENWFEPALYDLMLDSSIGEEAATEVALAAVRGRTGGK
jgi:cytidylate kinase